jgi:hypothetical protein
MEGNRELASWRVENWRIGELANWRVESWRFGELANWRVGESVGKPHCFIKSILFLLLPSKEIKKEKSPLYEIY